MTTEKIFPLILILLDVGAAVVYAVKGDVRMAVYWIAAAVLNICVTFKWLGCAMIDRILFASLQWVDRNKLHANDYNPNKVSEENLKLLVQSIETNGWTLPIVCRPDYTIIDGFHRWTVSGREPLLSKLGGKVPVVIVDHKDRAEDMYGTITHNRARGTHLLEPMKAIVKELLDSGKSVKEVGRQLGMRPEEVFRLSDFSKEDFINLMAQGHEYSRAQILTKV